MGDLTTYSLQDFFPFLPEVYFRLFVRHNQALWPVHILAVLLGVAALWLAWRGRGRLVAGILGASWAFVGYTFFLELYATLNWAGTYFGWAFIAQGALLLGFGLLGRLVREVDAPLGGPARVGVGLTVFAIAIYPVLEPLSGVNEWAGAEIFGISPDPTAIATLGLVLMAARTPWTLLTLLVVPVLWCAISGATAWVMGAPIGLATPLCGLIAIGAAIWKIFAHSD